MSVYPASTRGNLPPLPKLPAREMAGPTPWSNWAIPGRVIAGAYPASLDDAETDRILTLLLELGINTFVCIQAEFNINTPESAWRSQHGLRPYIKDAQKILSRAHESGNPKIRQQKIDFLHLPVIDGSVTTDSAMNRLAEDCIERVYNGENLYVHCWGGHGRTGTLISTMLGRLYNLPYTAAIRYCQAFHDSRMYPQGVRSPQTPVQRAQVRRLLTAQSSVTTSSPIVASSASRVTSATPAAAARSNSAAKQPIGSILSGGLRSSADVPSSGGIRSSVDPSAGSRVGASSAVPSRRPVGVSPLRSSFVEQPGRSALRQPSYSSADRLAAQGFGRIPGAGAASSAAVASSAYARAAPGALAARGSARLRTAQEVNVR